MIAIENQKFLAEIALHGAELKRFQSKKTGWNYLWDGNGSWKRSAPVLFPNIGGLSGGKLIHNGTEYPAPPHGFARDMEFTLREQTADRAVLVLESDERTAEFYPFAFALEITYALDDAGLKVTWRVENRGSEAMYFSIGAHPGFRLLPESRLEDYELCFDRPVAIETRRVEGRYLTQEKEHIAPVCTVLPLSAELMKKDAIVLEDTGIAKLTLRCPRRGYGLWIAFPDFPVVAFWTDPHAAQPEFLCLEPWCGINALCGEAEADIAQKPRVTELACGAVFERYYRIGVEE